MSAGAIPKHETRSASDVRTQLQGLQNSCAQDPDGDRIGYQSRHVTRTVTGQLGGVPIWDATGTGVVQNDIYASPGDEAPDISLKDAAQILGLDGPDAPTEEEVAFRLAQHFCNAPEFADLRKDLGNFTKAGLAAGAPMAGGHWAEVKLLAKFATNPVMRAIAVSWPYAFMVFAEVAIKAVTNYQHPDPGAKVRPPIAPAMAAAVLNWNYLQALLEQKLAGNKHLNALKVGASALLAALRGMVEHGLILRAISVLEHPEQAPQAYRPLTASETFVVNFLVALLRNVGGDILRQMKKGIEKQIQNVGNDGTEAAKSTIENLTRDLPAPPTTVVERFVNAPRYAGLVPAALVPVAAAGKVNVGEPAEREDDPIVQGNAVRGLNPQSAFNPFN